MANWMDQDFSKVPSYEMNPQFSIPQYGLSKPGAQLFDINMQMPVTDPNLVGFDPSNPATYGGAGGAAKPKLGWNMPTMELGLKGLGSAFNLWNAFQANKIAKDQLAWSKEFGNANLNNSIKSYNTQLDDRAASRMSSMGWTPEQVAAYTEKNKVSR
jgi:hypothetical protein